MTAMTLRLPTEVHEKLRQEAFDRRTTVTALILEALTVPTLPVQPSSTVDEGLAVRLAEMLYDDQTGTKGKFATSGWRDVWVRRTQAVVDAWRGESRG